MRFFLFVLQLFGYYAKNWHFLTAIFLLKVLSVTYVKGGSALNVIASHVEFGGTLRSLTTDGLHQLMRRLKEVCIRIVRLLEV